MFKLLLEQEGISVSSCADARSALDLASNRSFDIYVVDYRMPELSGDSLTSQLRQMYPDSFIIGYSIEHKEQEFLAAGADKFVSKDHLLTELILSIKRWKRN